MYNYHRILNRPLYRFSQVKYQTYELEHLKQIKQKTDLSVIDFSSNLKSCDKTKQESFSKGKLIKNDAKRRHSSILNKSLITQSTQKIIECRMKVKKIHIKKGEKKKILTKHYVPRENIPMMVLKSRTII